MPMYESMPVRVKITVEVDGHTFSWEKEGNAKGARYHGENPRKAGYSTSETLESSIRSIVFQAIEAAEMDARRDIFRLYPVTNQA